MVDRFDTYLILETNSRPALKDMSSTLYADRDAKKKLDAGKKFENEDANVGESSACGNFNCWYWF